MRRWALLLALALTAACASPPAVAPPLDLAAGESRVPDLGAHLEQRADHALAPDATECPVAPSSEANVVATRRGLLRGQPAGSTIAFLGVPYAEPPVGARRFAPPEKHACWSGVRDAKAYGDRCAQRSPVGNFIGDEDCLFLNVWTPALPAADKPALRPVLFFIHGGANILGASNEGATALLGNLVSGLGNLYDGQTLASQQQAVVVSVNYRLGPLGFLAHPELTKQSASKSSGNYAILDVIAALEWTQRNIQAFGGDPGRVMVFGESAGAAMTCMLLVSPLAKGLFQTALMESGGCQAPALASREAAGQKLAVALGCNGKPDVAACLRAAPAADLFAAPLSEIGFFNLGADILRTWDLPWGANVDGVVLPLPPMQALREGKYNHVPFVIGSNAHEGELFLPAIINTCIEYTADINLRFGALASQVLALYPCMSYLYARWAEVDVITDAVFTCPARRIARAVAGSQSQPVYRYQFTHIYTVSALLAMRAFHGAELPFVFQSFGVLGILPTGGELGLSQAMQRYWAAHAASGQPAATGSPAWAAYVPAIDNALVLDTEITTTAGIKSKQCDFWDALSE